MSASGAQTAAAIITAAAAVVSVLVAQWFAARRARSDRAYERRRTALLDTQEAALELGTALRSYGAALRRAAENPSQSPERGVSLAVPDEVDRTLSHARARLEVMMSRLEDTTVAAQVEAWRRLADVGAISSEDVSADQVQQAWAAVNAAIGTALRARHT